MNRYDIAQTINGGVILPDKEGDYIIHDAVAPAVAALELFVKQWNACGPNSNFGRIFQPVYAEARAALAHLKATS